MSRPQSFASPTLVISLIALFLALGGSALAVGQHVAVAQPRCANGAVRGVATIVGEGAGMANLPGTFTGRKTVFSRTFNCSGRGVLVRRLSIGVYEVRFVANAAPTALATGLGGGEASADPVSPGLFRVRVYASGISDPEDRGFSVVAV